MYNEDLKYEFIRSYTTSTNTAGVLTKVFNQTEKYELIFDKDICQFNLDELQETLDNVLGIRASGRWSKLAHLRSYVRWCLVKKVSCAEYHFDKIVHHGFEKMKNTTVANPMDLQRYLDATFDDENLKHVDNISRACFWLAFSGLPENVLGEITRENIDFKNMKIYYQEFVRPIYVESLISLRDAVELTEFVHDHGHYQNTHERAVGVSILRTIHNGDYSREAFKDKLKRKQTNARKSGRTEKRLSINRVYLSGMFYRLYQLEIAGVKPDFASLLADSRDIKNSTEFKHKNSFYSEISVMNEDYQNWKFAHGYI